MDNRAQDQATRNSEAVPSVQHDPLDVIYDIHKHTILCFKHVTKSKNGSLVDRGANRGVLGNDARVILQHHQEVDVRGINSHELNSLKIVDASAVVQTQFGEVILIMKQYAYHYVHRTNRVLQEHSR